MDPKPAIIVIGNAVQVRPKVVDPISLFASAVHGFDLKVQQAYLRIVVHRGTSPSCEQVYPALTAVICFAQGRRRCHLHFNERRGVDSRSPNRELFVGKSSHKSHVTSREHAHKRLHD